MKESDLQKQCNEYLTKLGYPFIHLPNRIFSDNKYRSVKNLKGKPDLIIFAPFAQTIIVELKTESSLKPEQKREIEKMRELGHNVWIITSFNGFVELLYMYVMSVYKQGKEGV